MRSRATAFGAPTMSASPSRPISPAGRSQVSRSARLTSPRRAISASVAAQTCRLESPTSSMANTGGSGRGVGAAVVRRAARADKPRGGLAAAAMDRAAAGNPSRSQRSRISRSAARGHERAPRLDRLPDRRFQPAPTGARHIAPLLHAPPPPPARSRAARSRSSLRSAGVAARSFALSKARIAAASPGPSAGGLGTRSTDLPMFVVDSLRIGCALPRSAVGASSSNRLDPSFVVVDDW